MSFKRLFHKYLQITPYFMGIGFVYGSYHGLKYVFVDYYKDYENIYDADAHYITYPIRYATWGALVGTLWPIGLPVLLGMELSKMSKKYEIEFNKMLKD